MPRGGSRPGSGPKRGAKYRKPAATPRAPEADQVAVPKFETALDFAMHCINSPDVPLETKTRLAIAAMPFQSARLAEIPAGKKKTAREEAVEAARSGKFATPPVPRGVIAFPRKPSGDDAA